MPLQENCFIQFTAPIDSIALPDQFTFPFAYEPHALSLLAADQLQKHLKSQTVWDHNFGLTEGKSGPIIGKMFGVLVVQNQDNEIGFLAAFSGKLAGGNHHALFVPPVFDMLEEGGWFNKGMEALGQINRQIERLENTPEYKTGMQFIREESERIANEVKAIQQEEQAAKKTRRARLKAAKSTYPEDAFESLKEELRLEASQEEATYKALVKTCKLQLLKRKEEFNVSHSEIAQLKAARKQKSGALQQQLFDQYHFLNKAGEQKSLIKIFEETPQKKPPAGSGECAAPKLLQYAFSHQLKPIALAEFWWGLSPKSEQWKHQHFYPSCDTKCRPILKHMLAGIEMEEAIPPPNQN